MRWILLITIWMAAGATLARILQKAWTELIQPWRQRLRQAAPCEHDWLTWSGGRGYDEDVFCSKCGAVDLRGTRKAEEAAQKYQALLDGRKLLAAAQKRHKLGKSGEPGGLSIAPTGQLSIKEDT